MLVSPLDQPLQSNSEYSENDANPEELVDDQGLRRDRRFSSDVDQ